MAWYPSLYAPRTGGAYDSHHRTAGIAGRTWRRGGRVAARGARAAGGDAADHRFLGLGHACGPRPVGRRFCAAAARTRLDRGSQPYDRVSVGGGKRRPRRRTRGRVCPPQGRCHRHVCKSNGRRDKAGDIGYADALYVCVDTVLFSNRISVNTLALSARLPTIFLNREYVEAGGLMSYGPSFPDLFRRAGGYVDKILHGAKPGNIPVEQPTKFALTINLTTAKALGLKIPPPLLARADEVIE